MNFISTVETDIKGGASVTLGHKTIIIGKSGSGKSRIATAIQWATTGEALDEHGRVQAKFSAFVEDTDGVSGFARVTDSKGGIAEYRRKGKGKKGKTTHSELPYPVSFPLAGLQTALTGNAVTVRKYFSERMGDSMATVSTARIETIDGGTTAELVRDGDDVLILSTLGIRWAQDEFDLGDSSDVELWSTLPKLLRSESRALKKSAKTSNAAIKASAMSVVVVEMPDENRIEELCQEHHLLNAQIAILTEELTAYNAAVTAQNQDIAHRESLRVAVIPSPDESQMLHITDQIEVLEVRARELEAEHKSYNSAMQKYRQNVTLLDNLKSSRGKHADAVTQHAKLSDMLERHTSGKPPIIDNGPTPQGMTAIRQVLNMTGNDHKVAARAFGEVASERKVAILDWFGKVEKSRTELNRWKPQNNKLADDVSRSDTGVIRCAAALRAAHELAPECNIDLPEKPESIEQVRANLATCQTELRAWDALNAKAQASREIHAKLEALPPVAELPIVPESAEPLRTKLSAVEVELRGLEDQKVRAEASSSTQQDSIESMLADIKDQENRADLYLKCAGSMEREAGKLFESSTLPFCEKVSAFLPSYLRFGIEKKGDNGIAYGLYVNGLTQLYTHPSGAQLAMMLGAIASATATANELSVAVIPDKQFDSETLTDAMVALSSSPAQVLLMSAVEPVSIPDDWVVIRTS